MQFFWKLSLPIFISVLATANNAVAVKKEAKSDNIVAEVNGKKISIDEFHRRYNENIKYFKFTPPTKINVLNDIIKFDLGVEEAKKTGLDKDPEIQHRLNTILYQALLEKKLADKFKKIDTSEKEIKQYCKRYPEIRTSHVYVPLRVSPLKAEEEEANKKIKSALDELNSGKKFEEVVAKYSEGFATNSGGDIGFQMKDKLDPVYYEKALALKQKEYTKEPVRSQYGLHIIRLDATKSCDDINMVEWGRMIYDEQRMKFFNDYLDQLRSKAKVSINYPLIKE